MSDNNQGGSGFMAGLATGAIIMAIAWILLWPDPVEFNRETCVGVLDDRKTNEAYYGVKELEARLIKIDIRLDALWEQRDK